MTRSEYQDLVEFLGRKFDAIDRRFEAIEGRLASLEDRMTRVEVSFEENRHQIQILAEGISAVDEKLDRFRDEVAEEFRAVREEMARGFFAQGERIDAVEARMGRWEGLSA
jgi:predicted  nucleic acid-binding Zn-ribbon protein